MEKPGPFNFLEALEQTEQEKKTAYNRRLDEQLIATQKAYDDNQATAQRLRIDTLLGYAKEKLKIHEARETQMDTSPRPYLARDYSGSTDLGRLSVHGSSTYSVTLKWFPKGTYGVEYSIGTNVNGDKVMVSTSRPHPSDEWGGNDFSKRLSLAEIDETRGELLEHTLFDAYSKLTS